MFQVNNKDSRATSLMLLWCPYCWLWMYFATFSSLSIINIERVNVCWVSGVKHQKASIYQITFCSRLNCASRTFLDIACFSQILGSFPHEFNFESQTNKKACNFAAQGWHFSHIFEKHGSSQDLLDALSYHCHTNEKLHPAILVRHVDKLALVLAA